MSSWCDAVKEWDQYITMTDLVTYTQAISTHVATGAAPFFSFSVEGALARFVVHCAKMVRCLSTTEIRTYTYS